MSSNKNIVGFRKFSEFTSKESDTKLKMKRFDDDDIPMNTNLPKETSKIEETPSIETPSVEKSSTESSTESLAETSVSENKTDDNVKTIGKVAKFPKNIKASKAFNFLENVKVSKKSIWYIMIEKQDNELQMLKYNYKEGVDLVKFVNNLKSYYINKYAENKSLCRLVEQIEVDGNDKYSMIKNIPLVNLDNKKMITKLTEDLIKLLSK